MGVPAIAELAAKVTLLWIKYRPFSAEARARRRAKRERRKAERQRRRAERRGEPLTRELIEPEQGEQEVGMRTSTNAGIAGIIVNILIQVLQWLPATAELGSSPEVAAGLTAIAMWIVARISKTPANPGVL